MPWKESVKMDERVKFVSRCLDGEKMTDLCREFGVSRKTGYKIYNRYVANGLAGLSDESRKPKKLANLTDSGVASLILKYKREKPTWGAPKLRELFLRKHQNIKAPAISTIHALLDRSGLVKTRKNREVFKASGTYLSVPTNPNDLWCTDYKGQFSMGNKSLCYPLTITDQVSRFILGIDCMERISENVAKIYFSEIFREYGLPDAIRSDNGVPFATQAIFGLSKLSIYWLRLGIKLERIKPGNPQQNGVHERMHRTLKAATTKPPANNLLGQQEKIDDFIHEFNFERPHEALSMKTPSDFYRPSKRKMPEVIPEFDYKNHDFIFNISTCGTIRLPNKKRIYIGEVFNQQTLATTEIDDGIWEVYFMDYKLGFYDTTSYTFTRGENPFDLANVIPQSARGKNCCFSAN